MSDGTTQNLGVIWDRPASTDTVGTFTYTGTVNGYSDTVSLILTVVPTVSSIADISETANHNSSYTLPETLTASMSDGTTQSVGVTWDRPASTETVGTFTYTGTVSGYDGTATLTLTIVPIVEFIPFMIVMVNHNSSYTLPEMLTASMSDGTTQSVGVTWDSLASTGTVGTFTYTGTVSGYDGPVNLTLKVVPTVATIADISETVNHNSSYTLPETLTATMSDGTTQSVGVTWDGPASTDTVGTFTYTGTVIRYDGTANLILTVVPIISLIADISETVNHNSSYILPETLTATMSDGTLQSVEVTWDRQASTDTIGTFTYTGTVNGHSETVSLNLTVIPTISIIANMAETVTQDDNYSLPVMVTATMSDGTTQNFGVTWDRPASTDTVGTFTYTGTVNGYSGVVTMTLVVTPFVVNFPDPALESDIRSIINKPIGDIYKSDVENLNGLFLYSDNITNIDGLEYFSNVQYISSVNSRISNLSPLSGLTNLTYLNFWKNQISDLSPLSGLTNLTYLMLAENQISDLSPLSGLTNLDYLCLHENQINDIRPLSTLTNLSDLCIAINPISDVTPVLALASLRHLNVSFNPQYSDLSIFSSMTNLTKFAATGNQITDLRPLTALTNLTELYLSENQISNITPLYALPNLQKLDLSSNPISDIEPLSALINLKELQLENIDLWYGDISDLSGLIHLNILYLSGNDIYNLNPLSGLTNLNTLELGANQIYDLSPLSGLINLEYLDLHSNNISELLPLYTLTDLYELDLTNNPVDSYTVSVLKMYLPNVLILY
jgi:Leucine-rich repeat (LRR) protein/small nuclear ribonucleoprotein (snRNP)-like protein